ncbi:MAG TPA: hypothetical protein VN241_01260 [Microbacterium sp.]|nr:hypothetical protein [Microbacterium sp.]
MTDLGDSSIGGRVQAVEAEYRARQARMFRNFALIEGALLAAVVLIVYVFGLVDPELGKFLLAGVAVLGGLGLSLLLMQHMKSRNAAIAQARGENPLF